MVRSDGLSLRKALPHYERAVALDTSFALAWSRVACVYTQNFSVNPAERSRTEGRGSSHSARCGWRPTIRRCAGHTHDICAS